MGTDDGDDDATASDGEEGRATAALDDGGEKKEKFPIVAVATNGLVVSVNAYAVFQLFTYVGVMVSYNTGVTIDEAGYYAGLIGSAFMIGRSLSSLFWGVLSDIWGRKFVIIWGCCAMVVFQVWFGLSRTFEQMLISRMLLGLNNGLVANSKTMASELVGASSHEQARSMGIMSAFISMASLLGPAAGGWLTDDSIMDKILERERALETGIAAGNATVEAQSIDAKGFPFFGPNLVGALLAVLSLILSIVFLPETLPRSVRPKASRFCSIFSRQLRGVCAMVFDKNVRFAVLAYSWQSFNSIILYEVFPLFVCHHKDFG